MAVKTGILGGAFNPPHLAHLALFRTAMTRFGLERFFFIPSGIPPHRTIQPVWDNATRLLMVRVAAFEISPDKLEQSLNTSGAWTGFLLSYRKSYAQGHDPRVSVSDRELALSSTAYTIDTVRGLKNEHPGMDIHLVMGMDQATVFDTWKEWEKIPDFCRVCVTGRAGGDDRATLNRFPFMEFFDTPPMNISSTLIREKWSNRQSLEGLVPKIIEEFLNALRESET